MRKLRAWCGGSIFKSVVAVLGLTAISLPFVLAMVKIYVLTFGIPIQGSLFSQKIFVYLIPGILVANLIQLETAPNPDRKKASIIRELLEIVLIAAAVCALTLIPLDSPKAANVLLWFACILVFGLICYAFFKITDKK